MLREFGERITKLPLFRMFEPFIGRRRFSDPVHELPEEPTKAYESLDELRAAFMVAATLHEQGPPIHRLRQVDGSAGKEIRINS